MIQEIERPFAPYLDERDYPLAGLASVPTPRLVVFRRHVEENIRLMRSYLEEVAPGTGFEHLRTHVKTHKSAWATRRLLEAGVRIFPDGVPSEDFEPEYIAEDPSGDRLYVTLQEANAVAVFDLTTLEFTTIIPLGLKDHSLEENALDFNDDEIIDITTAPSFSDTIGW